VIAGVPLAACVGVALVLAHAAWTGEVLGFLPGQWRHAAEMALGVPDAAPGEGTRWRLDRMAFLTGDARTDAWLVGGIAAALAVMVVFVYRRERPTGRGSLRAAVASLAGLRLGLLFVALFVLLPQLKLAFEREGWPDVVLLFDDSRSMSVADAYTDPKVRDRAKELADVAGLTEPQRLQLAQALVSRPDGDWISKLLSNRQMKVHVYHAAHSFARLAEVTELSQAPAALEQVKRLRAEGEASHLGSAVRGVLNDFRGSSLAAVVVFTDGVTTAGPDMIAAGRAAAQAGVPLYLVGMGDAREARDLILSDLQVEDVVNVNDRLVFEARLTARGQGLPESVPVILYEKKGDKLEEKAREQVRLDPNGKPVKVRLTHTPPEAGEKTYVLEVPAQADESETANNRLERVVIVAEARRLQVLYIEGTPRYEFRFIKALLERESDAARGNKSIDLKVLLIDADPEYASQDKSALADFPTREQLFAYDVVILGDVDPKHPRFARRGPTEGARPAERNLQNLADFVKQRGGGLLFIAGPDTSPHAYRDTPLADILPVVPDATPQPPADTITQGSRPRLTPVGQSHPIFRFVTDEAENAALWERLEPMLWSAGNYRKKASAEVLATHRDLPAAGSTTENHPLVLQQFVGAGRVLFYGFDETWRWREREHEARFNQFWYQTVRYLARNRLSRVDLRLDRQTPYRRGEPVKVTVRFPDDAPPPDGPITVVVQHTPPAKPGGPSPEAEVQTLQLAKPGGSETKGGPNGRSFEAYLTATRDGDYKFWLATPQVSGSKPRAEAKVLPPAGEMDNLRMNQADLERAAAEAHGKFYTLADADRVPDDLPAGTRVALNQPRAPYLLWNHALAFALAAGLLVTEWVLRKRRKLL
jgi:uncharacterized membrane protein